MVNLDVIVSLAKRRGFLWRSSDIYGGLSGAWDFGPMGVELARNIKQLWWKKFIQERDDMYGIDASILMNARTWEASGHIEGFQDQCPECGGALTKERQFNMMFETRVGAVEDSASITYLRPETAQGMFVNFKNILDAFHPLIPFGIGQTGKAFRNEITPKDFIFRIREFEQMEIEYFVREKEWETYFNHWKSEMWAWIENIGLARSRVHELEVPSNERAHYSRRTIDFEYDFPFGRQELYGLAYRADFDLRQHSKASGVELQYFNEGSGERFYPHVIEPTFGVERTVLALLCDAYKEDVLGGDARVYLALKPHLAPVQAAVFPLLRNNKSLVSKARAVYKDIKKAVPQMMWDDNGNIGKRYRRQDEIGTPWCITIDHQTLDDDTVTIRDRDSGEQKRVHIHEVSLFIKEEK